MRTTKRSLLSFFDNAQLIALPRKPPSKNHPFRKSYKLIKENKKEFDTEERNSRWLNQWCEETNKSSNILWTSELYPIEKKQDYFPKVDQSLFQDYKGLELIKIKK